MAADLASTLRARGMRVTSQRLRVHRALTVAYVVVGTELLVIAWVRRRFLHVPLSRSLIQVTAGGALVAIVGALLGHA